MFFVGENGHTFSVDVIFFVFLQLYVCSTRRG